MFNELYGLANQINNMYYGNNERSFPVDIIEGDGFYQVNAEIPGVDKDKIEVTFEDSTLTIKASSKVSEEKKFLINERGNKEYERRFYFGDIEEDSLNAKYENGILMVKINLKKPEEKQKKVITIE